MNRQTGFTLIELMVVVVIIAILTAIAVPQYSDYVTRSKIPGAVSGLSDVRVRMEQFFQDNRTYVGGCTLPSATDFSFACSNVTATTYTVTATGTGPMTGFSYTVDQSNARATTITGVSGWSGNGSCWVTKKGGVC